MNNLFNNKKILIICPYPRNLAAGQRLKYEQYIESWEKEGCTVTISSFFDDHAYSVIYQKHHYLQKLYAILRGYAARLKNIFTISSYDLVYIHMWVTPFGTSLFERIFYSLSQKMIYDIEDFITLKKNTYESLREFIILKVRSRSKFFFLIENANHVVTSSPDLNADCLKINKYKKSTYISSSLDEERFIPNRNISRKLTLGWTGTFTTFKYFQLIEPILIKAQREHDIGITVIGNFEYKSDDLNLNTLQWSLDSEISDLASIDIGLYPLDSSEWVGGKSGLKAIQYMAMGIPFVASNLGINSRLFLDGQSGFLASNDDEWLQKLTTLINDSALRKSMGINARMHFLNNYSQRQISVKYLNILQEVLE